MIQYGSVLVEPDVDREKFAALIRALNLTPPVLIKPNWGTVECYTEAKVLDWTLAAIPGEKIVIESHGWARSEEALAGRQIPFTRANLRKGDRWFLDYTGLRQVLERHRVEYLNLTEEVWAGRTAGPEAVRKAVEEKYDPLESPELYEKVPARLYALRGGSLLSLAKYKIVFYPLGVSMAVKNLFGLIPGPSRGKFHGKEHAKLDRSIVDINKIYHSLFAVSGVIEAVCSAGYLGAEEERTEVKPGCGAAFASRDIIALDAFATALSGRDPLGIGHLRLAGQVFGEWSPGLTAAAEESKLKVF